MMNIHKEQDFLPKKKMKAHKLDRDKKNDFFDSERFLRNQRNYINDVKQSLGLIRNN